MVSTEVLDSVRYGVCAVGYLTVSIDEFLEDPKRRCFEIAGTGFLVRDTTVITNRHVLEELAEQKATLNLQDEQLLLQFVYPKEGGWQTGFCGIRFEGAFYNAELDIGFIEFIPRPDTEFQQCRPLKIVKDASTITVGQPVGLFGYPDGTDMLVNPDVDANVIHRFGPVLQQGYVSALAPYDLNAPAKEYLLDVRTMAGMSGSPVFNPETGEVIAIHYAGNEITTSFAVPLDETIISEFLKFHDRLVIGK